MTDVSEYLDVHPDVAAALAEGRGVVALESTIISHGMPYPQSVEMARAVEQIVRDNGAVPATIAILGGRLKVGLTDAEMLLLATPIPAEAEIPAEEVNPKIEQAIAEMDAEGIIGKDQTPYLLSRIVEITEGRSLAANIALVYNNAKVAAQVAVAYAAG